MLNLFQIHLISLNTYLYILPLLLLFLTNITLHKSVPHFISSVKTNWAVFLFTLFFFCNLIGLPILPMFIIKFNLLVKLSTVYTSYIYYIILNINFFFFYFYLKQFKFSTINVKILTVGSENSSQTISLVMFFLVILLSIPCCNVYMGWV